MSELFFSPYVLAPIRELTATVARVLFDTAAIEKRQTCGSQTSQIGTYYTAGTNPSGLTACGNTYDPNSLTVAICTQIPNGTLHIKIKTPCFSQVWRVDH